MGAVPIRVGGPRMTASRTLPYRPKGTQAPGSAPVGTAPPQLHSYPDPIPGIISFGSVNFLAGASGVGKTCLLAWFLTRFRDEAPIFGHPVNRPTAIGYIAADRGWTTAKYWLEKVGYPDLAHYSLVDDAAFNPSRLRNKLNLLPILMEAIDKLQLPPGALLAVDPAALFISNLNDYHACAVACLEMRRLCTARGLTLLGLSHASKQKADMKERYTRLQDRINGSTAQLGYGDTQMYLAGPLETGQKHYTFMWHPHTALAEEFALGRSKSGLFVPWQESVEAEAENEVYAVLPEDGTDLAIATIQGLVSCSRATVFRRLQELVQDGLVEKVGEGRYRRAKLN